MPKSKLSFKADFELGHLVLQKMQFFFHFSRRGTNVMLCANHRPILNDVTHAELQLLLYRVSKISPVIANGLSTGRLTCYSSGQASPCLDLSRLNKVSNIFGKKNIIFTIFNLYFLLFRPL